MVKRFILFAVDQIQLWADLMSKTAHDVLDEGEFFTAEDVARAEILAKQIEQDWKKEVEKWN